jgi:hypothetical protein
MLYNIRHLAIEDFITAFKTSEKVYKKKLENEKERLAK